LHEPCYSRRWHPLIKNQHPCVGANNKVRADRDHDEREPEIPRASGSRGDKEGEWIGENERKNGCNQSNPNASCQRPKIIRRPAENSVSKKFPVVIERKTPDDFPVRPALHKPDRDEKRRRKNQEKEQP